MIKSMTGYGKAECILDEGKIIVEIRSLNGKNADISIKSSLLPRDREMETRQFIAKELQRGNIDLFAAWEQNSAQNAKTINKDIFISYYNQIRKLKEEMNFKSEDPELLSTLLRLPDVIDNNQKQELTPQEWEKFRDAIAVAVAALNEFRSQEGKILQTDLRQRVTLIESYVDEVEKYQAQRTCAIKERIKSRIEELGISPDENRLEQEIIYYLEKLDITEEKVRLKQHCRYFVQTMEKEPYPGKKLGFIAQEMGREINTMGSKANQADIQQWVVKMKDELEKIKEQSLNIL